MRVYPLKYLSLIVCLSAATQLSAAENPVNFNRDIRPILSDRCFQCHGPDEEDREEDLRLDIPDGEQGALTARDDYFIIKPGEPEESELWWRITEEWEEDRMPPADSHKAPLNEQEIAFFKQWISEGANYQDFWAFVAPEKTPRAKVKRKTWGRNYIDNRVLAHLEDQGLQPKAEADKRTLLRRLSLDLTGLPPTLEELDAYLADKSPQAYQKQVDRLLNKLSYGEHMARYWADLVRLADTNGMHKDFHREFSVYRDWLIQSFNDNLPFDEFIKYQLAGDLYEEPSRDQLVASGFNRLHLIIDKGTALPEESLHKNIVDRVEAFGTAFLGLTVQCAQCHDHKYDPITMKDYYQLYAFFNNFSGGAETVRNPERGLQPPFLNFTTPEQDEKIAEFEAEKEQLKLELKAVESRQQKRFGWPKKFEEVATPWIWAKPDSKSYKTRFKTTLQLKAKPDQAFVRFVGMSKADASLNGRLLGKARSPSHPVAAEVSDLLKPGENVITAKAVGNMGFAFILEYRIGEKVKTFTSSSDWLAKGDRSSEWMPATEVYEADYDTSWSTKVRSVDALEVVRRTEKFNKRRLRYLDDIPAAMIMEEMDPPRQATILMGGAYDAPGEPVERNTPAFLPPLKKQDGMYSRMDLAEWLITPNHPLTARVAVNRFWQQIFGVGLVKTSEDFGAQGEWPSHPELLDDLALRFMDSGWDVKQLVRDMVLSSTYKQSSNADPQEYEQDPENRNLARGSRYRLDAEVIRDQILAISGQLNTSMYGKSVKPPQPPGLWEMVSMAAPFTYVADRDDNIYRRSFYTYWRRGMPPPQMTILNAPSREYCVARRERTNTPLQALLLMNEEEYFNAAQATARITLNETDDVKSGLSRTYEKITSQEPSSDRLKLMEETLADFKDIYANDPELTESLTPELEDAEFDQRVELAAWTMMTHSLFNLELVKVRR